MILPPLFGAHTKSTDNSWETARLTFELIDLLSFNKPTEIIHNTFNSIDTMVYDSRTQPRLHITFNTVDVMIYDSRTKPVMNMSYGVLDIMTYSKDN